MSNRIVISVTGECNLQCRHCYNATASKSDSVVPVSLYKDFLRNLSFHHFQVLVLSGGEPLLRLELVEDLLAIGKQLGYWSILTTNAVMITPEYVERLKQAGLKAVQVSIDGSTPGIHDALRGPGAFESALKGLTYLRAVQSFQLNTMTVVTRLNINNLNGLLNWAESMGIERMGFERYIPTGNIHDEDLSLTREEYLFFLDWAYQKQSQNRVAIHLHDPLWNMYQLWREGIRTPGLIAAVSHQVEAGCSFMRSSLYVDGAGWVWPCVHLGPKIGHIREGQAALAVWLDLRSNDFTGPKCADCIYKSICRGCRAAAFHASGSMMGEDPCCFL
jgi:radical SAM protein with 4Fe4S-binding SPASM domain